MVRYGLLSRCCGLDRYCACILQFLTTTTTILLGNGRFGEVVLAEYRGTTVAVKTMDPEMLVRKPHGSTSDAEAPESAPLRYDSSSLHASQALKAPGVATSKAFGVTTQKALVMPSSSSKKKDAREQFVCEICSLVKLREHRNIVCVMGAVVKGTERPKVVLEYMERGSLFDLLHNNAQPIGGQLIHNILSDVIQGVRFLHNSNPMVVHSDIKV